jgi:oxygen-independent coproporphyrinogen III oxidase
MRLVGWMRNRALGLYVSVPFCRSKCTYCNFASGVYPASEHERYVQRVIEDLQGAAKWAEGLGLEMPPTVDTVYLGGGTPSLLEPELIRRIFNSLRQEFDLEADAEITVECAPGQIAEETLEVMAEEGVNRVSLGVQSFVVREAQISGRLHSRAKVMDDLMRLRAAGIENLNLDLIAGLAGQTYESWNESLEALIGCGAPHASVYMLEVDEDSRLGREMLAGGARYHAALTPSEDAVAKMYVTAIESLSAAGLEQYEISNFARTGRESRHNLRYWERRPYLGVGLDASSMLMAKDLQEIVRTTTTDDLKAYLAGGAPIETAGLNLDRQHEEAWFLGLRLNRGVLPEELTEEFGVERVGVAVERARRMEDVGLVEFVGGRIRLTGRGRLLSNEVFQEFLEAGNREQGTVGWSGGEGAKNLEPEIAGE